MRLEIRVHGHLLRYTGRGSLALELPEGSTLEEVLNHMGLPERHGFAVFVNLEQRGIDALLAPGDCVDLVPVEEGGSGAG